MRKILALLAVGCAVALPARDTNVSTTQVQPRVDSFELTVACTLADVQRMLPATVRLGTDSSRDTIDAARAELEQLAARFWEVRVGDESLSAQDVRIEFTASDDLAFTITYARPEADGVVFRATMLTALPSFHRAHFTYCDEHGNAQVERLLTARSNAVTVSLLAGDVEPVTPGATEVAPTPAANAGHFFQLGLRHVCTGSAPLLFLFGLLVVARSFKSVAASVACFMLASSLTFALATGGVVNPSGRFVALLIAGSIVFLGIENLVRLSAGARGRGWLVLAFGLIHGLGFAAALREHRAGADEFGLVPLPVMFNFGLVAGIVVVVATVLPIVWWLRENETFRRFGAPVVSSLVAVGGLYLALEQTRWA